MSQRQRVIVLDTETRPRTPVDEAEALALQQMSEGNEHWADGWTALSPCLAEVTCVAMARLATEDKPEEGEVAYAGEPEKVILEKATMALRLATRIVTFNGRGFDLPLLLHRCIVHNVTVPSILLAAAREPRYKANINFDLLEQFTFSGAVRSPGLSLRAFALAHGLPDPKARGDGRDAKDMTAEDLAAYCLRDVRTTMCLYKRWVAAVGE